MPLYLRTKIHHSKRLQLQRSCFLKANRGVGNNGVAMAKNNTKAKCWCKCFGRYSPQELKAIYLSKHEPSTSSYLSKHEPSTWIENNIYQTTWTINIFIHIPSQRNPMPQQVFLPQILLRGHGCLCSVHPRPPWPPGAAPPRGRGLWGLPSAAVRCLGSREPEAEAGGQNPTERRGEKFWDKFWAPQKSKFWKLLPLKILPELQEHCAFETSWGHRVGSKKLFSLVFYRSRVSHVCNQDGLG